MAGRHIFQKNKSLYVQYGCGFDAPDTWINFDSSPTLRFERLPLIGKLYTKNEKRFPDNIKYGNIVSELPIKNESCDGIYCSHVLEHLALKNFRKALENTYAYLKPGGIFRLVIPDLYCYAEEYMRAFSKGKNEASMNFMKSSGLGIEEEKKGIFCFFYEVLSGSRHKWMWDYHSLNKELKAVGFLKIRKSKFNDSSDKRFGEVENKNRFEKALAMECRKPLA